MPSNEKMCPGYDETLLGIFDLFGFKNGASRFIVEDRESLWSWLMDWKNGDVVACDRCHKPLNFHDGDTVPDSSYGKDSFYHRNCWDLVDSDASEAV